MLHENLERLNEAERIGNFGYWTQDVETGEEWWSKNEYRIHGLPDGVEPSYELHLECVHPDDREDHDRAFKEILKSGSEDFSLQYRIAKQDGEVRYILARFHIERDAAGRPLRAAGTDQDITERVRLEQALRKARDDPERKVEERTADLAEANRQLKLEVEERRRAEEAVRRKGEALREAHDELESKVRERTEELAKANERLKLEIEEHKKTEDELRVKDSAIASSINAIGITDLEGRLIYVNDSCVRMWGYKSRDEMLGRLLPEFWEGEGVYETVKALRETGGRIAEDVGKRKDGSLFQVQLSASMIKDEAGNPLYMFGSFIDISDRKQAEQQARQREQSLAEAQRIAHLGNWEWDVLEDEVRWSAELFRLLGEDPLRTKPSRHAFLERVHPQDRPLVEQHIKALMSEHKPFAFDHRIVRRDGLMRVIHSLGRAETDAHGRLTMLHGIAQDVTERKQIEDELRQLRADLTHLDRVMTMGTLTAALAHEINQPLASILSNAQASLRFLDAQQPDIQEVREALRDIAADVNRTSEVVRRLRVLSKKQAVQQVPLPLNDLVQDVLNLLNSEIVMRSVSVDVDLQGELPTVKGDPVQIQQVILNLTLNALDAVKDCGGARRHVLVSSRTAPEGGVTVAVSDSGPGVAAEKMESVFEPFYSTKVQGMGLGLSICRTIIEAHGGLLWAENDPNGGAVFSFRLPSPEHTASTKRSRG